MPLTDSLRDDILASVPSLRAFAISLSGNGDRADDLVQETLLRAIANIDSFQPGSNLPAWLFTILRNLFRSDYRKRRREVEDAEGNYAKTLKTQPAQNAHLEFEEFRTALDKLPQDQREALILVGASGFSYEDAAAICGCAVGTIKSRVNRARSKLSALLYVDGAEDFGPDETVRAVIGGSLFLFVTKRSPGEAQRNPGSSRAPVPGLRFAPSGLRCQCRPPKA
jgi:RNA polymerase sigma-70 factor, ECF subfamily